MRSAIPVAWRRIAAAILLAVVAGTGVAADAPPLPPPSSEQVERRLGSVAALIESSSGARQIEASDNADARRARATARELHRVATEAFRSGDLQAATQKLDLAAKAMFDGVRLASSEQVNARKDRSDFDLRLESTRALLEAQKRIVREKGSDPRTTELARSVEALLAEAQGQVAAGKLAEGRKTLDQAYAVAKAAIGGMRGGDTLVRTLSFASKEEEYRYEIDRNDTHRMLIDVLLREKRGQAALDGMIDTSVREAARLRSVAEEQAAKRDFAGGIRTLEDSTRELVRAIRGAGVYIPG